MAGWNLWHGCRKVSEGCRRCYVYRQDARWEQDASQVRRTAAFDLPVRRDRTGRYKIPPGQTVYTCFTSDFFIEEADAWRGEAWAMIRERSDCTFLMITKRIDRVAACLPADWGEGWPHVALCCTCETQERADYRLPIYLLAAVVPPRGDLRTAARTPRPEPLPRRGADRFGVVRGRVGR